MVGLEQREACIDLPAMEGFHSCQVYHHFTWRRFRLCRRRQARRLPRNYARSCKGAALGAWPCRLSEAIDRDVLLSYRRHGVDFEQRWFGPLNLVDRYGPLSVGEIASSRGSAHAAVVQAKVSRDRPASFHWKRTKLTVGDERSTSLQAARRWSRLYDPFWHQRRERSVMKQEVSPRRSMVSMPRSPAKLFLNGSPSEARRQTAVGGLTLAALNSAPWAGVSRWPCL